MATSKNFVTAEDTVKINGEAGADHAWSVEGLTDGAGRVSIQIDFLAAPRASLYSWSCEYVGQATPTQDGSFEIYLATAPEDDATQIDGDVGNADAALSDVDQLKNLKFLGTVTQEEADTTKMVGSGDFVSFRRYLSFVCLNNTGATINATDSNFIFTLTIRSQQGQAT